MTDRAQPGAIKSLSRNDELAQILGQFSDGWIVPGNDPTPAAQRRSNIDETALAAFDITHSATSLTVTVGPGEAFVDGWCCRDEPTDITLDTNSTTEIAVGWNPDAVYDPNTDADRDAADATIVDIAGSVPDVHPTVVAWTVETDGSGVVSAERVASVGAEIEVKSVSADEQLTLPVYPTLGDVPTNLPEGTLVWVADENMVYKETGT
jgi:hypothetical protein